MHLLKDILYFVGVSALLVVAIPGLCVLSAIFRLKDELYWGG